ncbi:MAG: TerB family tellurite resistance protein [Rhodobacteraceae bacterium]|nr:TerB family tellurite resistance protein [Paracoccaceae bacterium]
MGILGKLVGGTVGFALGGPVGALVGVATGHFVSDRRSRRRSPRIPAESPENRQAVFLASVVILAAKLCKVDGTVTRDEITTVRRVFSIPESEKEAVGALFNTAKSDAAGYEPYAMQIAKVFGGDREMCKNLVASLIMIACADGAYHPLERRFIANVADILDLSANDLRQVESMFAPTAAVSHKEDPYQTLGMQSDATDAEIKAAHRKILMENHPDLMMARGLPEELRKIGDRKLAAANAAYDEIKRIRKAA